MPLEDLIDATAQAEDFSGVVRVDRRGTTEVAKAYGYADRAYGIANTVDTQFGTASATKTFTALTVMALVEEGRLDLSTTARSLLGDDLPEIADDVTVEQLLAHRSGIGDYFDENGLDDMTGYPLPGSGASALHPRGVPHGPGRPSDGVRRRRALRLQQRWRTSCWPCSSSEQAAPATTSRSAMCPRACRHGRHGVPAVRRAASTGRARLPRPRRAPDQRAASPRRRGRRRRRVLHRGRPAPPLAGAALRSDRLPGHAGADGRPREATGPRSPAVTGWDSTCTRPATRCGWRVTTRGCRSPACTNPARTSPTP